MAAASRKADRCPFMTEGETMSLSIWQEIREIAWLASMVGCLSVLGVFLAAVLAGLI
jgi:hypothetical protein